MDPPRAWPAHPSPRGTSGRTPPCRRRPRPRFGGGFGSRGLPRPRPGPPEFPPSARRGGRRGACLSVGGRDVYKTSDPPPELPRNVRNEASEAMTRTSACTSTTPPCATASRRKACSFPRRRNTRSPRRSTASGSTTSRVAGPGPTPPTAPSSTTSRHLRDFTAFGMTKRAGRSVENDDVLAAVLNANPRASASSAKTHDFHVRQAP